MRSEFLTSGPVAGFSATVPSEVEYLACEILNHPVRVDVSLKQMTVREIGQRVVMVNNVDRRRMLEHLLRDDEVSRAIVDTSRGCRVVVGGSVRAQ